MKEMKICKKGGCYLCGTLNAYHDGPDFRAAIDLPKNKRHFVNLNEIDGKWYLMIDGIPYPVKACPSCGRKLDENTKFKVTDGL